MQGAFANRTPAVNGRREAIAAAGRVDDITRGLAVTQGLAQRIEMHTQVDLVDKGIRPDLTQDLLVRNRIGRALHKQRKDIQGAAAQADWNFAFQQECPFRSKLKRAKEEFVSSH